MCIVNVLVCLFRLVLDRSVGFIVVGFYNILMYPFLLILLMLLTSYFYLWYLLLTFTYVNYIFTYVLMFGYICTHFYLLYGFLFERPVGFIAVCFYIVIMLYIWWCDFYNLLFLASMFLYHFNFNIFIRTLTLTRF